VGFLPSNYHPAAFLSFNAQNNNSALIRALIAGAFNPQLARIEFPDKKFAPSMSGAIELDPEARTIKFFNQENGRVFVHPSSTLFGAQTFAGGAVYMSYFNKMATSKIFIRELTRKFSYPHFPVMRTTIWFTFIPPLYSLS
jgi:ATP-dependent RNA helicase DHX57